MPTTLTIVCRSQHQSGRRRTDLLGRTVLAIALTGVFSAIAHQARADDGRRFICHISRGHGSDFRNILVSPREALEHFAHGDFDGRCERDCNLQPNDCQAPDKCSVATCDHQTGQCHIRPKSCPDTDCTRGVCNPRTGGCVGLPLTGNRCDDGNACTTKDRCRNGQCIGRPISCDDQNPCTNDSCDPKLGCQNMETSECTPCPNGSSDCQDNNLCNGVEQCVNGFCAPGTPPICASTDPCLTAGCDRASGCTLTPNTNSCSDGNPCTTPDTCSNGTCQPGPTVFCDDGNACTVDSCDPSVGGCQHQFIAGCSPCQTAQDCGGDQCNPQTCQGGKCVSLPPPVCDDGNPCTADSCDPAVGCSHAALTDTPCAPGDVCSGFGNCQAGVCTPVPPLTCDDGNPCTIDTCDAAGCSFAPGSDGSACATTTGASGTCANGTCINPNCTTCESNTTGCTDMCPSILGPWQTYIQCVYQSGQAHGFGPSWCDPSVCGVGNCRDIAIGIFGGENPIGTNCVQPCAVLP